MFIDHEMIERADRVTLTMNQPQKKGSVIRQDRPWRTKLTGYFGTVIEDGGIYKMWTNCGEGDVGSNNRYGISFGKHRYVQYLESRDGLNWESPSLGLIEFEGSRNNNLIFADDCYEGNVFVDPNAPPESKFKYFHFIHPHGMFMYDSPDGIHWNVNKECLLRYRFDTQNIVFWDKSINKYVCYLRGWESPHKDIAAQDMITSASRTVVRMEVNDFSELSQFNDETLTDKTTYFDRLPAVLSCDEADPEDTDVYTNAVVKYPLADNVYLAFPSLYSKFKPVGDNRNDGVLEVQLAVSRDGCSWNRIRQPYLQRGPVGEVDSASAYMLTGMIIGETEILQYYWGSSYTHGGKDTYAKSQGVNRNEVIAVSQRIDGFVSADAAYEGGMLLTKPFTFSGDRLILNINTFATGSAYVAIVDSDGQVIQGFSTDDCDRIKGNFVNKTVTWNGKDNVDKLQGQVVRLQFAMRGTKLFSFRFE
ncbi:MAG: hypothetical protein K0Q73_7008 [Paenibacillus sp.]|nr:hypothetical protein [Paenibacillus sp.]